MKSCAGFIGNPFRNRSDLVSATKSLLIPIEQYRSIGGARVKFCPPTVAAFDDNAAQLEGFSRPLLGIGAFLDEGEDNESHLKRWMKGLAAGVDPQSHEYWGDIGDFDQRIVETESICIAFLAASEQLLPYLDESARAKTINWLRQVNGKQMPRNNWRWFRVFVNLTLIQVFHFPEEELKPQMAADFEVLDSFHIGHGWSSDGSWGEERRQADYYSGSFAIQFAQLLYVRFANGNEDRKAGYIQMAREFGEDYWRYFHVDGIVPRYFIHNIGWSNENRSCNSLWKKYDLSFCNGRLLGCRSSRRCRATCSCSQARNCERYAAATSSMVGYQTRHL
jgi:hypothetical protein